MQAWARRGAAASGGVMAGGARAARAEAAGGVLGRPCDGALRARVTVASGLAGWRLRAWLRAAGREPDGHRLRARLWARARLELGVAPPFFSFASFIAVAVRRCGGAAGRRGFLAPWSVAVRLQAREGSAGATAIVHDGDEPC